MDSAYQQALDYLYSFVDYETMHQPRSSVNYDLRRIDELLARLGNPHEKARSVHVAGTKGKGSVAAMIASVLTAAGYKTGLYTSPHLIDIRERFRINGELISQEAIVKIVEKLKPEVAVVNRKATYGKLTTFELLTVLAFLYFAENDVKLQVVEAGLGGRLDATNVIKADACVITSINLDHTEVLGNTLAEIAAEKAGIIKPGSVVVSSPQPEEAARVIEKVCLEQGTGLVKVGQDITWQGLGFNNGRQLLDIKGRLDSYGLALPLLGRYQLENAAVAVAALEALAERGFDISRDSIIGGLERVSWPGRFQIMGHSPLVVIDGAHSPASARELIRSLGHYFKGCGGCPEPAVLVFGTSMDKDVAGIVAEMYRLFDSVVVTRSRHPRSLDAASIIAELSRYGVQARMVDTVPEALSLALKIAGEQGFVCVTGSLFIVGEALEYLNRAA